MTLLTVRLEHGLKRDAIDGAFDRCYAARRELRTLVLWQDQKGPRVALLAFRRPEELSFETNLRTGFTHLAGNIRFSGQGEGIAYRNGLSAAKAASAPNKDKLLVAMPNPRERIQPLMPKLAKRNATPARNNIDSSAICGSAAAVAMVRSLGWLAVRTALNVIPSVTGRKATEAATAKNAAHVPARCSRAPTRSVP